LATEGSPEKTQHGEALGFFIVAFAKRAADFCCLAAAFFSALPFALGVAPFAPAGEAFIMTAKSPSSSSGRIMPDM
jgi:hypothetical protein